MLHGPGRGRLAGFRDHLLAWFNRNRPALAARLVVHRIGAAAPPLDGIAAMVCWLADPLRELYPGEFAEAEALAMVVQEQGGVVINAPAALSHPVKSVQAARWRAAGLPCAPAAPAPTAASLPAAIAEVGLPALVRADLHHAQEEVFECRTAADAAALPTGGRLYPAVALGFVDVRAAWRAAHPRDLRARWWHKKRAFVFGETVVPHHCLFAETPIVGLQRSPWWGWRGHRGWLSGLAWLHPGQRAALRADLATGFGPPEQVDPLRAATRALGLDHVAIDYSDLPGGKLILWEANPYFTLPVGRKGPMAGPRRLDERLDRIIGALADHLEGLPGNARLAATGTARR